MSFESDRVFLRAALPELGDFVTSGDIYRPLRVPARSPSGLQVPQLSIGSLVLSQTRLQSTAHSADQEKELAELVQGIQTVRTEWRTNWGNKAAKEYASRLNLWQQYMRELRGDVRQQASYYANEARQRTILQLLEGEQNNERQAHEQEQMLMLDQILRGLTRPGPFVWEPEAAGGFPQDTFWFLYVTFQK